MAAGQWTLTNEGRTELSKGTFLDADSFKIALLQSTSNIGPSSTTFAGVSNEVAGVNGYTSGGAATTLSRSGTTTVTFTFTGVTWTASGGSIVARFACLYEVAGRVLAYCLLDAAPADVTTQDGNQLAVNPSGSGCFTLS